MARPEGVAICILGLRVVAQPQVPLGGRAEKQPNELVILDTPRRGDCLVEQFSRLVLVTGARLRDRQAAEDTGTDPLIACPLGRFKRIPPEGVCLGQLGPPEGHIPGAGQGSGQKDVIAGSGGSLPPLVEQLLGSGEVAAQQRQAAEGGDGSSPDQLIVAVSETKRGAETL